MYKSNYDINKNKNLQRICICILFISIFIIGCYIYKDYGVHYDEIVERYRGLVNFKYLGNIFQIKSVINHPNLNNELPDLEYFKDGDHGPIFDIIAVAFELIFGVNSYNEIYEIRHFINFLFFWIGLVFFFLIIKERFLNNYFALLGVVIIILSPRIFAESFYNSKDIVFLSLFTISLFAGIKYLLNPNWKAAFILGLASGLATDVRLLGVFVPFGVLVLILLPVNFRKYCFPKLAVSLFILISSYIAFTYLFWPWLWHDPLSQIFTAFKNLSKFPVQPPTLYFGKYLQHGNIPWHYIPVWITITTPILYLIFGVFGFLNLFRDLYYKIVLRKSFIFNKNEILDLFIFGFFIMPILIVITLKSTLYDGWRHMYFIYPPFIYFAIKGFVLLIKKTEISKNIKILLLFLCVANLFYTANWMRLNHPFQNTYFNFLSGSNRTLRFDVDYWGLGIKSGLKMILNNDSSEVINLYPDGLMNMKINLDTLGFDNSKRFVLVDSFEKSKYVITNFRDSKLDYNHLIGKTLTKFKDVVVDGEPIISIYRVINHNE